MKTLKNQYIMFLGSVILAGIMFLGLMSYIKSAYGGVTNTIPTQSKSFENYTFFASSTNQVAAYSFATTSNATSTGITKWTDNNGRIDNGYFVIAGARRVDFYFGRGATTTQNVAVVKYRVQVTPVASPTEDDWYNFNKLVISTTTPKLTVGSFTQTTGTTTALFGLDLQDDGFYAARCVVNYASGASPAGDGDGTIFCSATATY